MPKVEVNLFKLVEDVVKSIKLPSKFSVFIDDQLPTLITEEVFLTQIFSNLISNAVKYNDKEEGRIEVSFKVEEDVICFFVRDNGPGISPQNQQRIFKAFELVVPERGKDSSGIGLSIVNNIVTEKGGKVWVDSDGKTGSTFFFTWPTSELLVAKDIQNLDF